MKHDAQVKPDGAGFKAKCGCGWQGVSRERYGQSLRDAMEHAKRARGA